MIDGLGSFWFKANLVLPLSRIKKKEKENAGDRDWELRKYVMQRSLRRSDVTLRASRDDHQLIN